VSNNNNLNLTYYALFGMLLVTVVTATIAASSSLLLLSPVTMSVFAQTEADEGGNDDVTTATTMMASGANDTDASPARNNNMTGVTFLFIQHAQSGSVSEINATTFTLELSDVSDKTIMFSDRPDRIVTSQSTSDFVGNWSQGEDSFAADPPNAVLVVDEEEGEGEDLAIIELYNPEYDSEANTLRYDITAENATATTTSSIDLPSEFGQSTLVIDPDTGPTIVTEGDSNGCNGECPDVD
jgi:hypothetical protein